MKYLFTILFIGFACSNLYCQLRVELSKLNRDFDTGVYYYKGERFNGIAYVSDIYKSGNIFWEGNMVSGKSFGFSRRFYPNGQIDFEEYIINDKKNGIYRHWDREGALIEEGNFKDDKLDGQWIKYCIHNRGKQIIIYESDKVITSKCWDTRGELIDCNDWVGCSNLAR